MAMFHSLLLFMVPALVFSIGVSAKAGCDVKLKRSGGKTFRAIKCDERRAALDETREFAAESCADLHAEFSDACYDAVFASFELRREAMLRRTLKEGATLEAAATLYGYTEEEVSQSLAANEPTSDSYDPSEEVPQAVLEAERALADVLIRLGLAP
jgi:hypothetical protein